MTIELLARLTSTTTFETNIFDLPYPMRIFEVRVFFGVTSKFSVVVLRDSELPPFKLDTTTDDLVINDNNNEVLVPSQFAEGGLMTLEKGSFEPIVVEKLAIDHIATTSASTHVFMIAERVLKDDEISGQLERDLLAELTQLGKPQIRFDEATGTYLDQEGNTVDFSDQEQILLQSVRQLGRE